MFKIEFKDFIYLTLFGVVIFYQTCGSEPQLPDQPDTTITNYTPPPVIINLPPSSNPQIIYQPIPADIDSFAIAQAYFSQVHYQDTIRNDSIQIHIDEIVSRNSIQSRSVGFKWLLPPCSSVVINNPPKLRNKLFIGGSLRYDMGTLGIAPTVGFLDKRDRFIFGSYGFDRSMTVGAMVKVRLRRD